MYESGACDYQPDVICYDALINAFGWSAVRGKGREAYKIYRKMLHLFETGSNRSAKPDIITCNSVLNACAYDTADTPLERAELIDIVVTTFEDFQANQAKFGRLNHVTYATVLIAISKHMEPSEQRSDLAEATFWQCAKAGHVSVLVIMQLHNALPWERCKKILGSALLSGEGENLRFIFNDLPKEWTRHAPSVKQRTGSRASKKYLSSVPVTKVALAKEKLALAKENKCG